MKILTEFQRNPKDYKSKLDEFYCKMKDQILKYQHPITGLFPLDPNDSSCSISHVRDSVYCATAIWALHKCYKRIDDDEGRTYELGQCIVKCMRSILLGWMRQCDAMEKFKKNQCPENSLHSILNYKTGELLDISYPHLQIDCVSLFLLQLVQMISSGLQIVYTKSEVAFVQNLIYYLERAYRIPDYGMWERGTKQNRNITELHASSIGMAKAALEAVSGFNVFGSEGDHSTVLFVDIDAHSRNRIILTNLLPRESASKGSDSALLPCLSWPAFGTHIIETRHETIERVQCRFQGRYGYKRFSRDGYKTVKEKHSDRLYESGELKNYERIENEWPMFLAFMIIEYSFRQNYQKMDEYIGQLNNLLVTVPGEKYKWLPKFYRVPPQFLEEEWESPGSVTRESSFDIGEPFHLMGQSLYYISQLLVSRCLLNYDIDPLTRHMAADERPTLIFGRHSSLMYPNKPLNLVIQVVLISESVRLQQLLATYGIVCQTPRQVEPIQIWPPDQLTRVFKVMGCCSTLKLTGRPSRPVGQLGTSKFYRISGNTVLSYPLLFEIEDFYLMHDMNVVVDEVKSDFNFLANWWRLKGRPTFCLLIKEDMMKASDANVLIKFLASMKCGWIDGVRVLLGRAQNFVASGCVDHLDFLHSRNDILDNIIRLQELTASTSFHSLTDVSFLPNPNSYELCKDCKPELETKTTEDLVGILQKSESILAQAQCLHVLLDRHGRDHPIKWPEKETILDRIIYLSRQSAIHQSWNTVRYCSAILGRTVNSLAPSISAILVNGKHLSIGVPKKSREIIISKPIPPDEIKNYFYETILKIDPIQAVLQQELILWVAGLIAKDPSLFKCISIIRMGWLVEAMKLELEYRKKPVHLLCSMSPFEVKELLEEVLRLSENRESKDMFGETNETRTPLFFRQLDGCLSRAPENFYKCVYQILESSLSGIIICGKMLSPNPVLQDMTATDLNFVTLVESYLDRISEPVYHSIVIEAFMVIAVILERNEELYFNDVLDINEVIDEAINQFKKSNPDEFGCQSDKYSKEDHEVWQRFYATPSNIRQGTTSYLAKAALDRLLAGDMNLNSINRDACLIS